jgi:mannose-6-phosphate isomerase
MAQACEIIDLSPYIVPKIWGGSKIAKFKLGTEIEAPGPIGESWEVSRLKEGPSLTPKKEPLHSVYTQEQIPYLVKFIDTSDNLSVQVHPGDEYAQRVESSSGKTECWLILESEEEAGIFLGLRSGVNREGFEGLLKKGEDLTSYLNFYPVKRGDFFYVPSGSIHAIGKGVTLVEIQQSSGITYRVWDWNRLDKQGKSRELHIKKALDVIAFDEQLNQQEFFKFQEGLLTAPQRGVLVEHRDFCVEILSVTDEKQERKILLKQRNRIDAIISLGGDWTINDRIIRPYSSVIIPSGVDVLIKGQGAPLLHVF